jgi:hypothetical protein
MRRRSRWPEARQFVSFMPNLGVRYFYLPPFRL